MEPLGDVLRRWLSTGSEVTLVAPFMKVAALERVLAAIDPAVPVRCITRWRPDEVARGVSDLEVFDVLADRGSSELLLCTRLHAKLYGQGSSWMAGSANLTMLGLGWHPSPNLEVLVPCGSADEVAAACYATIVSSSVPADRTRQDDVRSAADELVGLPAFDALNGWVMDHSVSGRWDPMCRVPRYLFAIYLGHGDLLSSSVQEDAREDLMGLALPSGLTEVAFRGCVRAALAQAPIVQAFTDSLPEVGAAEVGALIAGLDDALDDASPYANGEEAYVVLKAWLQEFFSDRYLFGTTPLGDSIQRGALISGWRSMADLRA